MMMMRDYDHIKKIFYHLAVVSMKRSNCFKSIIFVLFFEKTINLLFTARTKAVEESNKFITEICGMR